MYYRIIRNDILKSRLITVTTMCFVAAAAMLVSLAAILTVNLTGAIDTMMEQAKTPHFMQMHAGEINSERMDAFAGKNANVDKYQILSFLNVDGSDIVIGNNSLVDSVQDNGICTQSKSFDYLLDLNGNVIVPSGGEVYVPVCYWKDGTAKIGDRAIICGKEFVVAGFLRDSQMNSTLSSSKRFLISEEDYAGIENAGSTEYLIEFRLKDLAGLSEFENAYMKAGLEKNGPTVTWPLFIMLNAISDGMLIAVILLVSILIVLITLLCIRFTLLAKIEEEYREIGTMKAIGLRISDIKKIYLAKYAVITAAGSILGFFLSFAFKNVLLENIRSYMGESSYAAHAPVLGIIGILLVLLVILAYINGVLRRFRHISAAQAIRFGSSQEKKAGAGYLRLSKNKVFKTNFFLGIKDVLARKRLYVTMLAVLVFCTFIIIVPQNLYHTVSSRNFIQYMGIGECDMRIDIRQTSDMMKKAGEIEAVIKKDKGIKRNTVLTTKTFTFISEEGTKENLKIELGDHSVFPVSYLEGKPPTAENEIALSSINADKLGKKAGDTLKLLLDGRETELTVCGIYSDITNGGKTAKAAFTDDSADIMWCVILAELAEGISAEDKASEYSRIFGFAKTTDVEEYVRQTFGNTIHSIQTASYVAAAVSLLICALVTLLFLKLLIAKDRYGIAVMKALGFTNRDIKIQYLMRMWFILILGIIPGIFLANTLGEALAGTVIASFGAAAFSFTVHPFSVYFLNPLLMICIVSAAAFCSITDTGKIRIFENIKE